MSEMAQEMMTQGASPFMGSVEEFEELRKKKSEGPAAVFSMGRPSGNIPLPGNLEGIWRLATLFSKSNFMPKEMHRPEDIFVAIQMGMEVGLAPMQSVQNIAPINGRPTIWGDMLLALVMASGELVDQPDERYEGNYPDEDFKALCTVQRRGRKPVTREFSIEDARTAGLLDKKGPWQNYPKRMLQMRARAFALRDTFADVLKGVRIREEEMDGGVSNDALIQEIMENTMALHQQPPAESEKEPEAPVAAVREQQQAAETSKSKKPTKTQIQEIVALAAETGIAIAMDHITTVSQADLVLQDLRKEQKKRAGSNGQKPGGQKAAEQKPSQEKTETTGRTDLFGGQEPEGDLPQIWKPSKRLFDAILEMDPAIKPEGVCLMIRDDFASRGLEMHEDIEPKIEALLKGPREDFERFISRVLGVVE